MKIALIGYGKMGQTIHALAKEKNEKAGNNFYDVSLIVDIDNRPTITLDELRAVDVAIEFTSPHTAVENIKWCFEAGIPIVVGSTGWTSQLPEIQALAEQTHQSFLFAPNFSIGVNIFFEVNRYLAEIMNKQTDYDVILEEIHHTEKKDAPSGTALHAALDILKRIERKKEWENNATDNEDILSIISKREPDVPGTHHITYENEIDKIELIHTAHSRKGFAGGALTAAQWLIGKKGVYSMEDVLGFS